MEGLIIFFYCNQYTFLRFPFRELFSNIIDIDQINNLQKRLIQKQEEIIEKDLKMEEYNKVER